MKTCIQSSHTSPMKTCPFHNVRPSFMKGECFDNIVRKNGNMVERHHVKILTYSWSRFTDCNGHFQSLTCSWSRFTDGNGYFRSLTNSWSRSADCNRHSRRTCSKIWEVLLFNHFDGRGGESIHIPTIY